MHRELSVLSIFAILLTCDAFSSPGRFLIRSVHGKNGAAVQRHRMTLRTKTIMKVAEDEEASPKVNPEEITKKYGLEAGLFTAFTSKNKEGGVDAKALLTKYGSAYLVTSITLALISFTICYFLVDAGVDVGALLSKVGISADAKTETAGTAAIAYAFHKAASPIRFPPTVALTPLTAKYLFNRKESDEGENKE